VTACCAGSALFACLSLAMGEVVHAQAAARPTATFEAEVVDSQTGQPIRRVTLWGTKDSGDSRYYAAAATSGTVRVEGVVPGEPVLFSVQCGLHRRFQGRLLDSMTTMLRPGQSRHWSVRTSAAGCDQRPFTDSVGVFTGLWRTGFEQSEFTFCDSAFGDAWADRDPGATEAPGLEWPDLKENEYERKVYIRVEGRLLGPWRYGHMGGSEFSLTITRVLEVRPWSGTACGEKPG
jgi:hypothetical protein